MKSKIYQESVFGFKVISLPIFQQKDELEQCCIVEHIGGSKGGARDAPRGSKFFQFHAVFGEKMAK